MEEAGLPQTEGPPPLPYSLRTRKKSIAFFWTLFVIDTLAQPLILYWALKYCTSLSLNLVFTISTAALGGISVFEYFYRLYNLMRKDSRTRPLNARKSWLDFFHINFTIVWLILAVELIVGTVNPNPHVRLLAMPLPTVMFYFGAVHLTLDVLRMSGFKAPFRISSTHQGSAMPTALYVLVEDIVAVDGGGGQKFRYALRNRYLSSPYFRRMLFEMNCFWAGGSLVAAAGITAVIFTTSEDVGYTLGWSLPFAWAAVWTLITFPWVQAELRREKETWNSVPHFGGEPFTDDITVNPRTRYNSFQARILPFSGREKQAHDASSPPGSSTVTDETTTHANTLTADNTNNTNNTNNHNHNHNHTNSNDNTESTIQDIDRTTDENNVPANGVVAGDESRASTRDHDYGAREKEPKPDI